MKRINVTRKDEGIRKFVRSLLKNSEGSILELEGEAVLKVTPIPDSPVDKNKLRAAIRKRRNESRRLNQEWDAVDREMWEKIPESESKNTFTTRSASWRRLVGLSRPHGRSRGAKNKTGDYCHQ